MNKKLIVVCLIVFLGIVLFPTNLIGDPTLEKKTDPGDSDGGSNIYENHYVDCLIVIVTPTGSETIEGMHWQCYSGGSGPCTATDCQ